MQQQLKIVPGYYEGIVAEGDQGEFFGALDRVLQKHPAYVDYLKDLFLNEAGEDRKEILGIILEAYDIPGVTAFLGRDRFLPAQE